MVESGRLDKKTGRKVAWPWTVHANGQGYYYNSKEEAVAKVYALQKQGINNIDVGCMQINLKYHGHAFNSVEDALDPEKNIAYSASFLRNLYARNGHDWQKTAMQYHSKNHQKGLTYKFRLEKQYAQYINAYDKTQTLF
jgi:soluble lytic murein transglycosylase-like protein